MKKILLALMLIASVALNKTFAQQPSQTFTLDGSLSSDPENQTLSYQWRLISGPGPVLITNAGSKIATVTGVLKVGKYIFELEVTDPGGLKHTDRMEVNVSPNADIPPNVNAGVNQNVQLPATKFTLSGSATDANGNGTIIFIQWSQISGPNTATIASPGAYSTDVTNFIAGNYRFRLKIGDNGGASAADTVDIAVIPGNQPPAANAGPDQSITLPVSTVKIGAPDPLGVSVQWVKVSGSGIIEKPNDSQTNVNGLKKGTSVFRKTITTPGGLTSSDDVIVTVKGTCFWLWHLFGWC